MNKPRITLLPQEDVYYGLNWTCVLNGGSFINIGYGRSPEEAWLDYTGEIDVFEDIGMNVEED